MASVASASKPAPSHDLGSLQPNRRTVATLGPHCASPPQRAFRRQNPRQEPAALIPHAGICPGGRPQGRSLPGLADDGEGPHSPARCQGPLLHRCRRVKRRESVSGRRSRSTGHPQKSPSRPAPPCGPGPSARPRGWTPSKRSSVCSTAVPSKTHSVGSMPSTTSSPAVT